MEPVTFHFYKSKTFFGRLVEWRTGSDIAHVSIELRGNDYNAYMHKRFYKVAGTPTNAAESYTLYISKDKADLAENILEDAIGTLYDFKSIYGFIVNSNSNSRGRVYCSEIANLILELIVPGEVKHKKLISPDDVRLAIVYFKKGIEFIKFSKGE